MERRHSGPHPHGHGGPHPHGPGHGRPPGFHGRPPMGMMPPLPPPMFNRLPPLPFGIRFTRPVGRQELDRVIRVLNRAMIGKPTKLEDAAFMMTVLNRPVAPHEAPALLGILSGL